MAKRRGKHPRLADRDYEILDHISRYRMSTREILHSLFFKESELNAVTKVTSRLAEYGFLNRYDLHSGKSYFVLGTAGAKLFGISPKRCKPLGPQSLVEHYAILLFCCASEVPRQRLLVREMQQHLESLRGKHLHAGMFYVDSQGACPKLACLRIDHGGPPAHVVRKCRFALEAQIALPQIAQLVTEQRFMLSIITSSGEKAKGIEEAILRHTWPVTFRVEAVADLALLIASTHQSRLPNEDAR